MVGDERHAVKGLRNYAELLRRGGIPHIERHYLKRSRNRLPAGSQSHQSQNDE